NTEKAGSAYGAQRWPLAAVPRCVSQAAQVLRGLLSLELRAGAPDRRAALRRLLRRRPLRVWRGQLSLAAAGAEPRPGDRPRAQGLVPHRALGAGGGPGGAPSDAARASRQRATAGGVRSGLPARAARLAGVLSVARDRAARPEGATRRGHAGAMAVPLPPGPPARAPAGGPGGPLLGDGVGAGARPARPAPQPAHRAAGAQCPHS